MRHWLSISIFLAFSSASASEPHEAARDAVRDQDAMPLEEVLTRVQAAQPGELLDVQMLQSGRAYTYRLKLMDPSNRVRDLTIDGQTGEILRSD